MGLAAAMSLAQMGIGAAQAIGSMFGRGKDKRAMSRQEGYIEDEIRNVEANPLAQEKLALARRYGYQGLTAEAKGIMGQGSERAATGLTQAAGTLGRGAALSAMGRAGLMRQQGAQNVGMADESARLQNRAALTSAIDQAAARTDKVAQMRLGLAEARYTRASDSLQSKKASFAQGMAGIAGGAANMAMSGDKRSLKEIFKG